MCTMPVGCDTPSIASAVTISRPMPVTGRSGVKPKTARLPLRHSSWPRRRACSPLASVSHSRVGRLRGSAL